MVVKADARQLMQLGKQLRALDSKVYLEMRREMRDIGSEIAEQARENASSWSEHIPASVNYGVTGPLTVVVRAGNSTPTRDGGAANAKPLEHAGKKGSFRHPVFGHGWVKQEARPFLNPAAVAKLPVFAARITAVFLEAINRIHIAGGE